MEAVVASYTSRMRPDSRPKDEDMPLDPSLKRLGTRSVDAGALTSSVGVACSRMGGP